VTIFVLRAFARSDAEVDKDRGAGNKADETTEMLSQQFPAEPPKSSASAYSIRQK